MEILVWSSWTKTHVWCGNANKELEGIRRKHFVELEQSFLEMGYPEKMILCRLHESNIFCCRDEEKNGGINSVEGIH